MIASIQEFVIIISFRRHYFFRESIEINKETAASIWHPLIAFENIKNSKSLRVFGDTDMSIIQYSGSTKLMYYVEQYQLTLSCHFYLSHFPLDSHKCCIEFGSLWYETKLLNLSATIVQIRGYPDITPKDGPTIIADLPYPFEFQIESLPPFEIDFNDGYKYSFTGALLTLERKTVDYLLVGYYYPTTAFALLSMISFLIDADIVSFFFSL